MRPEDTAGFGPVGTNATAPQPLTAARLAEIRRHLSSNIHDCAFRADIAALLAEVERLRAALKPFAAFADVIEPGDFDGRQWASSIELPDEGSVELRAGMPDDIVIIGACSSWRKIPASYVTQLTLGEFRQARAALGENSHG